jgi:hypothetical protein
LTRGEGATGAPATLEAGTEAAPAKDGTRRSPTARSTRRRIRGPAVSVRQANLATFPSQRISGEPWKTIHDMDLSV